MSVVSGLKDKTHVSGRIEGLYILKDRVTGQKGEIMHAVNNESIIRTFGRIFEAGKHNFLIRDLELFHFADVEYVPGDPFPVIYNIDTPVCILCGYDFYEEIKEGDND